MDLGVLVFPWHGLAIFVFVPVDRIHGGLQRYVCSCRSLIGIEKLSLAAGCHPDVSDSHLYELRSKPITLGQDSEADACGGKTGASSSMQGLGI